ncbi:hypothetical protein EUTSA_v10028356mg [Eutrema salsugineum]|uniref:RING-type E3 ubiquitin transferase n=1 Tax=Eutrema salsugineum TaxID=72664 RepID=V4LFG4_EUTSA|nr:hypothetical protein EUTSA_v10029195mg [Eutrema salsugineum]ESQ46705.1 hypothetical protein EUTSA_v10028356mg [Eutrema salsugineum]
MNPDLVKVELVTEPYTLPPSVGFLNTIRIHMHDGEIIEELVEDQNGMVTHLGSYLVPSNVSCFELIPRYFTPHHISQLLHLHIGETQLCQILGQAIALDCALLHGRGRFLLSVHVKLTRQVRFMLPPSVTVTSRTASDYVIGRLADEQRVKTIDLEGKEEEEPRSCSICMDDLSESSHEYVIEMPKCLHMFHQDCICEWLKLQNSCPLCRQVPYDD